MWLHLLEGMGGCLKGCLVGYKWVIVDEKACKQRSLIRTHAKLHDMCCLCHKTARNYLIFTKGVENDLVQSNIGWQLYNGGIEAGCRTEPCSEPPASPLGSTAVTESAASKKISQHTYKHNKSAHFKPGLFLSLTFPPTANNYCQITKKGSVERLVFPEEKEHGCQRKKSLLGNWCQWPSWDGF